MTNIPNVRPRAARSPYPANANSNPGQPTKLPRPSLAVEYRSVADLAPAKRNARTHSERQIQQIAASIDQFGFINPVLLAPDGSIIAGHGRVAAAKLLGLVQVPTIRLDHLTDAQKRAYILTDNRLAELAGWDEEILKIELGELLELDLGFEIELTGFETADIDRLLAGDAAPSSLDDIPELQATSITRPGDLFVLGQHRLLCGSALEPAAYDRLLADEKAQMVFTDPPYNVPVGGNVSGLGRVQHREFAMASGEMTSEQFTAFLTTTCSHLAEHSIDGSIHMLAMDWRHMREMLAAGDAAYTELKNLCVWGKDNGGMGTFYRSQHEFFFIFKNGTAAHINNFGLGEKGRYRSNLWSYTGQNTFHKGRNTELSMHPTVKPTALVVDAIKDCSKRNGLILDCFGGSGTTLIAAEKTKRRARLIELDPAYCDVIVRRWEALTGNKTVHADTGQTFDELAAERAVGTSDATEVCDAQG